jgi:anti-anti-sigma factor
MGEASAIPLKTAAGGYRHETGKAEGNLIQMTEETRNGWRVVTVTGRADSEGADALETALRTAVEGNDKVVADFKGLNYISSAGLRSVLQAARAAQTRGSEFAVCGLTEFVRKVFDTSGLNQILHIHGELPC